ncbi:MAG: glycosyltransferase family 4 protein, partial [Acidobacteriota bacterium]
PGDVDSEPFTIGYLSRVSPEKGLLFLCEAYRRLRRKGNLPPSRLWAAGYLAPEHRTYLDGIRDSMESWGLSGEFRYFGEVDREGKLAFLKKLGLLSVPGLYDDPKGMFLLEAMAAGVPVVQPRRGAFTEIVENTGGGILVEPDDPDALAEGILALWQDSRRRRDLASRAYRGVREHYGAARMAERVLAIYREIQ